LNEWIAADFKGLKDVTGFERRAAELKNSKEVRQAIRQEKDQVAEQKRRFAQIFTLRARLGNSWAASPDPYVSGGIENRQSDTGGGAAEARRLLVVELRRALGDLKSKSESKENTPERALARRIFNQYSAYSFELMRGLFQAKKYEAAANNLEIEAEITPDNPRPLFHLARAHALNGNRKKALDALKKAAEKGFNNVDELISNDAFASLRDDPVFQKAVEEVRKNSLSKQSK
jgi:tetratricopeptide (TPR) repeat protein